MAGLEPEGLGALRRAPRIARGSTTLVAFGSTRRAETHVEHDAGLGALVEAVTPACAIFGKSSTLHVTDVLRTSLDENLRMIEESVAYLVSRGRRVIYDAEHFFDGFAADAEYALGDLRAAARGGAEAVVLCDTNGACVAPVGVERAVRARAARAARRSPVGIHAHNDVACATANALTAVRAGAAHVQGTINGFGERCGNTDLCAVIPTLELKMGARCLPDGALRTLPHVARFVAEVANVALDERAPYVGHSAFAHKAAGPRRGDATQPGVVQPRRPGARRERDAHSRQRALGKGVDAGEGRGARRSWRTTTRGQRGARADQVARGARLRVRGCRRLRRPPLSSPRSRLRAALPADRLQGHGRSQRGRTEAVSEATIKIDVGGEIVHTAAEGVGPVHALDAALRKALTPRSPR